MYYYLRMIKTGIQTNIMIVEKTKKGTQTKYDASWEYQKLELK